MPYVIAVATATPPNYYEQDELIAMLREEWREHFFNPTRLESLHHNVLVSGRHLALPLDSYSELSGLRARNEAFISTGMPMLEKAVSEALAMANCAAGEVRCILSSTVTGLAVPSLEARLMNRLPFAPDTKRIPLFGLGCVAGVAGLARMADYLKGHPNEVGLVCALELCSLTLQKSDLSIANIISSGLFGDGAGVVLMAGDEHPLARNGLLRLDTWLSSFFPNTEGVMGFDIVDDGFKVVLSAEVPDIVTRFVPGVVDALLDRACRRRSDLSFFISHPGGPKVLKAMAAALEISDDDLGLSYASLNKYGNMSSASVLFVLAETLKSARPRPGSWGLMTAMGPAFCAEAILVEAPV